MRQKSHASFLYCITGILPAATNNTKKSVAIEVDGSHHFTNNGLADNYTIEHIERMEILTRAGWNIINTPYHKWYKDGWLSEQTDRQFKEEINRIYNEINSALF